MEGMWKAISIGAAERIGQPVAARHVADQVRSLAAGHPGGRLIQRPGSAFTAHDRHGGTGPVQAPSWASEAGCGAGDTKECSVVCTSLTQRHQPSFTGRAKNRLMSGERSGTATPRRTQMRMIGAARDARSCFVMEVIVDLGPVNLEILFLGPEWLGVIVDADVLTGGGFIGRDPCIRPLFG
jgi:hypothetical protein